MSAKVNYLRNSKKICDYKKIIHLCSMLKKLALLTLILITSMFSKAIKYTVDFSKVKTHYVSVKISFKVNKQKHVDFKVPVWTPGSYKVREFSNAFEDVSAGELPVNRLDKNTWRIYTKGADQVELTYDVYCFVVSVRQSYADEKYAFLHGVSVFGYLEGYENDSIELLLNPLDEWTNVEVSLPKLAGSSHAFICENYDLLVDSPIALGNFDGITYESGGVPHKIVMIGEGNYNLEQVRDDFKKISDVQITMMGGHPSTQYVHFIYNVAQGGGGLEHLNSQTSMMSRWNYANKNAYRRFLGLIAHEYFHLWNVKRVRPIQLGPFDYNKEVYTDMLWIAEGITSYYDDLTLLRAGLYSKSDYLRIVASNISKLENTPGKTNMSLAHSSLLAWVKAYLPNEESSNRTISYYNKGMIAAVLLDLEIRLSGDKSLDDVMKFLYDEFYIQKNRGFTFDEFSSVCSRFAGKDLTDFFNKIVYSTDSVDYTILDSYGLKLSREIDTANPWTGITSSASNGKVVITKIQSNSPAAKSGLSVNDELVSIGGWRLRHKVEEHVMGMQTQDEININFARDDKMYTTKMKLVGDPNMSYELVIQDDKNNLLQNWLQ